MISKSFNGTLQNKSQTLFTLITDWTTFQNFQKYSEVFAFFIKKKEIIN